MICFYPNLTFLKKLTIFIDRMLFPRPTFCRKYKHVFKGNKFQDLGNVASGRKKQVLFPTNLSDNNAIQSVLMAHVFSFFN